MFTIFIDIINGLKSLGKVYTNVEMVRKFVRCLPRSWGPKVTAIEEAKYLTKMGIDELLGSLLTHEITMKSNEEFDESKKKKKLLSRLPYHTQTKTYLMMKKVIRRWPCLQDDSTKYSKRTNFHKDNLE